MTQYETLAPQKISNILKKNGYSTFRYSRERASSRPGMMIYDCFKTVVSGGDFKCTKCMTTEVKVSVRADHKFSFEAPCRKYEEIAELLRTNGYEVHTNDGRCYLYVRKPLEN